jgi:hypothetical protein
MGYIIEFALLCFIGMALFGVLAFITITFFN